MQQGRVDLSLCWLCQPSFSLIRINPHCIAALWALQRLCLLNPDPTTACRKNVGRSGAPFSAPCHCTIGTMVNLPLQGSKQCMNIVSADTVSPPSFSHCVCVCVYVWIRIWAYTVWKTFVRTVQNERFFARNVRATKVRILCEQHPPNSGTGRHDRQLAQIPIKDLASNTKKIGELNGRG